MTDRPRRARRVQLSTPGLEREDDAEGVGVEGRPCLPRPRGRRRPAARSATPARRSSQALKTLELEGKTRCVRINDLTTEYAFEDIIEVVEERRRALDTIMMTKVHDAGRHPVRRQAAAAAREEAEAQEPHRPRSPDRGGRGHAERRGHRQVARRAWNAWSSAWATSRPRWASPTRTSARPTAIPATSGTTPASGGDGLPRRAASIRSTAHSPTSRIPTPIARSAAAR